MLQRYIFILYLLLAQIAFAQEFEDISFKPDAYGKIENELKDLGVVKVKSEEQKKKEEIEKLFEGKSPEEIEKLQIEMEKERRIKEQSINKFSDDFLLMDPNLNLRYSKGSYLVYDCLGGYWVCTAKEEYERCTKEREISFEKMNSNLICANFRKFDTQDLCLEKQRWLTDYVSSEKRFCLSEKVKAETFKY